jgi:hypothetical protein
MPKPTGQRIQATLDFLLATNLVTQGARTAARALADAFLAANYPGGAGTPAYDAFSRELSLGGHLFDDPDQRRQMARALFLLWRAIQWFDGQFVLPKANVGQITLATADRKLANYIVKAHCVQNERTGGSGGATHALTALTGDPLTFLRDNKVIVLGSGAFAGPDVANVQACNFRYNAGLDRYEFTVNNPVGGAALLVDSVKAFHWTDPRYLAPVHPALHDITTADFGNMLGIPLSGVHIMVTTQFTGCSFCMAEHANVVYCAHVSPAGVPNKQPDTNGPTLARRILATGAMANAPGAPLAVYGRTAGTAPHPGGYNLGVGGGIATYMTVLGFPQGNTYRIFAQTTENGRIQGAPVQIF